MIFPYGTVCRFGTTWHRSDLGTGWALAPIGPWHRLGLAPVGLGTGWAWHRLGLALGLGTGWALAPVGFPTERHSSDCRTTHIFQVTFHHCPLRDTSALSGTRQLAAGHFHPSAGRFHPSAGRFHTSAGRFHPSAGRLCSRASGKHYACLVQKDGGNAAVNP